MHGSSLRRHPRRHSKAFHGEISRCQQSSWGLQDQNLKGYPCQETWWTSYPGFLFLEAMDWIPVCVPLYLGYTFPLCAPGEVPVVSSGRWWRRGRSLRPHSCVILGTLFNGLNLSIFEKVYDKSHLTGSESTHMGRLPSQGPPPLAFCVCLLFPPTNLGGLYREESLIFLR